MREIDTQIRDYFEAIAPPFEVGDLVRTPDETVVQLVATERRRRRNPMLGIAAAIVTLVVVGGLPWLLRSEDRDTPPATDVPATTSAPATTGELMILTDTVLEADHVGTIVIAGDGVTLDCAGHEVRPPDGETDERPGIWMHDRRDVTVRGCVITGFDHGLGVSASETVVVTDNVVRTSIGGIGVSDSTGVEVSDNTVELGDDRVDAYLFQNMRNSVVRGNTAIDATVGFSFEFGSTGNLVEANTSRGGSVGIEVAAGDTGNRFRRNTIVDPGSWSIDDRTGGDTGPALNEYDENRCTGAPSMPPAVCGP